MHRNDAYLYVISERKHPTRKLYFTYDNNQCYNDVYDDYKNEKYIYISVHTYSTYVLIMI